MISCNDWCLSPLVQNARGNKCAYITGPKDALIKLKLDETKTPFDAGSFNPLETVRLNLDLAVTDMSSEIFAKIDEWVIDKLAANPKAYFKTTKTRDEIAAIYKPSITPHEKDGKTYTPTIRSKINTAGPRKIKCWTQEKTLRDSPEDWRQCEILPIVSVKGLWFMSNQCGCTYEIHDCILNETETSCPF